MQKIRYRKDEIVNILECLFFIFIYLYIYTIRMPTELNYIYSRWNNAELGISIIQMLYTFLNDFLFALNQFVRYYGQISIQNSNNLRN